MCNITSHGAKLYSVYLYFTIFYAFFYKFYYSGIIVRLFMSICVVFVFDCHYSKYVEIDG